MLNLADRPSQALCGCAVILLLGWAAVIDWQRWILPDWLTLPLLASGLLQGLQPVFVPWPESLLVAGLAYAGSSALRGAYRWRSGLEGLGGGDVKLLAALGAWLGGVLPWVVVAAAGLALMVLLALRRYRRHERVPFGPFLAFAGAVALLERVYL